MKSNRKRKDARFPKWILDALTTLRQKYEWNFTEALMRCTEKGINYYEKQWQKLYRSEEAQEKTFQGSTVSSNCQEDNKPKPVTDEELEQLFNEVYGKKKEDKK